MCLERLSIMDDPSSPLELGDGEGDESEDVMHVSEARQNLYAKVFEWEHRKDANLSRLPWKSGYHVGEKIAVEPVEWTVVTTGKSSAQEQTSGFVDHIKVVYRTADGQLVPQYRQVSGSIEKTLEEMLTWKNIIYSE